MNKAEARHLARKQSVALPIRKIAALNSLTYLLTLGADSRLAEACRPGQFFNLRPHKTTAPLLRRPISICDARPQIGEIDFLVRRVGEGTSLLVDQAEGEVADLVGPLGNPFSCEPAADALLIAGGVGVAPLHFLAGWLHRIPGYSANPPRITFCYGARTKSDLVLLDKIEACVSRLLLVTEDGSAGKQGLITDHLGSLLTPSKTVFVCGPSPMMNAVLTLMRERGVEGQFSLENRMGCGVGACQGCVVPGRKGMIRVCCDGPVVLTSEIDKVYSD